jgi:uncharacterized protein YjbI with pentapeptide repeats
MNGNTKKKAPLLSNWRVLLVGAFLGAVLTAGAFAIFLVFVSKAPSLKWAGWTGFGEDTTKEESIEKNAKGQLVKRTEITKHQSEKTLWDFLELLAVPVLLAMLGYQLQHGDLKRTEKQAQVEKDRAKDQAKLESEIAAANLRDQTLQAYVDHMAELLLNQEFRKELLQSKTEYPHSDNSARDVARVRTVTILRRLEGDTQRQARVLHFLGDAEMLKFLLKNANLMEINLQGAILQGANLMGANLQRAILQGANLQFGSLQGANLEGANLQGANLEVAYLQGANLEGANLEGAILRFGSLEGANLQGAKISTADQIKAAKNWEKAYYSPDLRQELGLPPEPSEADKG